MNRARHIKLDLSALYTIADLVDLSGGRLSRQQAHRLFRAHGVEFIRQGRSVYISLSEIKKKMPLLWDGILEYVRLVTNTNLSK